MKQTAVEWLEDNLIFVAWAEEHFIHNKKCLEQAKEMEKEQMKYFIQVGYYAHSQGHKKTEELYEYWINNFKSE